MKKKTLIPLAVIAIVGIGIMVINACSKSKIPIKNIKSYDYQVFNPNQENIIPLITAFNSAYKNYKLGFKSSEDKSLDEALWILEASLNYEYRSIKDSLTIIAYDSTKINIEIYSNDNSEYFINGTNLMLSYDSLLNYSTFKLLEFGQLTKIVFGDLEIISLNENDVTMKITLGMGQPKPRRCFVQPYDFWHAANNLGNCEGGQPQAGILDASDRIDELIDNRHCSSPVCPGGGQIISYASITSISLIWNYQSNNWYFWYGLDPFECFEPSDISYWYDYAENIIEFQKPSGKIFMDVEFIYNYVIAMDLWIHCADPVRYGIPVCGGLSE